VRTGIFVQVRLGSTRLPSKALLPLRGGNLIAHVMRSLARVPADERALLTDSASAEALTPFADAEGFKLFAGSPEDVLARYCDACRRYGVDRVVRACGDNPLTSPALAREIMAFHARKRADLSHYLGCPWGTGVEVVESGALFEAEREATDPVEREHITTYHYRHPERFSILEEQAPAGMRAQDARVSIDTREDYERVRRMFEDLYAGAPIEADEVVRWVRDHG